MKKKKTKDVTNVEFGMEFGDMNSGKLYELTAFSNSNESKSTQREKHKK
jgi:hypothetical protein